jgi:DNA-binding LacI/PurR family transcriptional regulator
MRRPRGRPRGPDSIYEAVAKDIGERISNGEWRPGRALPSNRQLALHYKLSQRSIRRALWQLAGDGRIVIQSRRRPIVAREHSLKDTMQGAIAVVMSCSLWRAMRASVYKQMLDGLAQATERQGAPLLVLQHTARWRTDFPSGLRGLPLKGTILMGYPFRPAVLKQYEGLGIPVIVLDQPGAKCNLISIAVDNDEAVLGVARRLVALGHRHIALLRFVNRDLQTVDLDDRERIAGFQTACSSIRSSPVHTQVFSFMSRRLGSAVGDILKSKTRFTAIVTSSVDCAEQIAVAAEASGLKVPRDLSIVSFNTSEKQSRDWSGPRIDFAAMARKAIELIENQTPMPLHLRLKATWNSGATLAPLRTPKPGRS